jgi:hypothetical protein
LGNITLVDSVSFPAFASNMSYSRVPDGSSHWLVRPTTFNLTNGVIDGLNNAESQLLVYPTAFNDYFCVNNAAGKQLILTDLTGKVLLRKQCKEEHETIQAGFLQPGMYILNVGNAGYKLIKL